jgi:hypothetical protein
MTSFNNYRESLLKPLLKGGGFKTMPYIRHYKAIFKRLKLKPLYSINLRAYILILIEIYIVIAT